MAPQEVEGVENLYQEWYDPGQDRMYLQLLGVGNNWPQYMRESDLGIV